MLIQHQILVTNLQGNVLQQEGRINNQILGVSYAITQAWRQLWIDFTRIFTVFVKLPTSWNNEGNFWKTLKIHMKLILDCPKGSCDYLFIT